jgi:hypothetical protein
MDGLTEEAYPARPDEQPNDDEDRSSEDPTAYQGYDACNNKDRRDDPKDRADARPTPFRCEDQVHFFPLRRLDHYTHERTRVPKPGRHIRR